MLPLVWFLGTCLVAAVGLATALHLFGNRLDEALARLRDEVNKDAARIQTRADAADDRLADECVGTGPIPAAVRDWQERVTEQLVKVGGQRWDWDTPDVMLWAEREVELRKVRLHAEHSRRQVVAWAMTVLGGLFVAVGGYLYLAGGYLSGS